ncbi:hypothetical protein C8R45DRAFT_894773 [Mycena sanguinolenta]|nr:hypothetical protein C8R45DRAFT_894773 [Mycena sanguinolenta]
MAALDLESSPTTEPQSKKDRVLHAAETALSAATDILALVSDFTENVPYINAVTGVINKLIEIKKEVDDNKDRANVLVLTILDVSTDLAQALRDMPEEKGGDSVSDALKSLADDLKAYERLLKGANLILQKWLSSSRLKIFFKRDDFKSMADGIEYKLAKFREAFELKRLISLDVGQSALKVMSQELADKVQSLVDDNTRVKLRDWLKAADVGQNQKAGEDRYHTGTGNWFLEETAEFQQWKYSPHSLLWLHGISGCGKTLLSSAVIKMLRDTGETIVYFYFDATDDGKQKLEDVLRTLISRLSECSPHAATTLKRFWSSHSNGRDVPSNRKLREILQKVLEGITTPVYIVLDALDESSETDDVLDAITEIRDANIDNVHLFLTSRTEVTYTSDLFSSETAVHLEGSGLAKDIKSYVDHITVTDKKLSRWSLDVRNKIQQSLVNVTDPMFRLVALQLDQLRRCLDESDVDAALSTMPTTMNEIYDRILEKIQSDQRLLAMVNRTLNWLIFSMRPMSLKEVIDALAVDFQQSSLRFNPKKQKNPILLLEACAGLVSQDADDNDDGTTILRLAHSSVKEYLTDSKRSSRALQAQISDYAGHYMIARTCIAYLCSFDDYDILKESPLALYAAQNWYHHVNRCSPGLSESFDNGIQRQASHDYTKDSFTFQEGADVNMQLEGDYVNALQAASQGGHPEIVWVLLEKGADVNAQGGALGNALQAACYAGNTGIVRVLLEKGANVNAQGGSFGNALNTASFKGHTEIVRVLLGKGADVNARYGDALQAASGRGHANIVQVLLDKGADVNAQGGEYGNALQAASSEGHSEIVRALLEKGADVNAQGGKYANALQAAISEGHADIMRLLVEKGADVKAQDGCLPNTLQATGGYGMWEYTQKLRQ